MKMNRRKFTGVTLAAGAGFALSACSSSPRLQPPTIREVIDQNASLSTLARALSTAGVQSLGEDGPFTVFAPRNSAFAALPQGTLDLLMLPSRQAELTQLLQLHVVRGTYTAADLVNRTTTLETLSGLRIIVDGFNGLHVGGVNVVQPDVVARNGVIHVVDGIIRPAP
jgi:uncharacterized surface protein with fasciclin (FAS1) repeats